MDSARDRRRAALFLLTGAGLLVLLVGVVTGIDLLREYEHYTVHFQESVAGLRKETTVDYKGVPVGEVTRVDFLEGRLDVIEVRVAVRKDLTLRQGTRARLRPQGITGTFYLALEGGDPQAPPLPPGSTIPADPSLTSTVTGIAHNVGQLADRVNAFTAEHEVELGRIVTSAAGFMERAEETMTVTQATVADVRSEVRAAAASLRATLAEAEALLGDPALKAVPGKAARVLDDAHEALTDGDLAALMADARRAVTDLRRVLASLERSAQALQAAAEGGGADLEATLQHVRRASRDLERAASTVREDPSRLIFGRKQRGDAGKPIPEPLEEVTK